MAKKKTSVLAPQLNWDRITDAVRAVGLESYDNDDVAHMLVAACDKWLDDDYRNFKFDRIEEKWVEYAGEIYILSDFPERGIPPTARYGTTDLEALGLRGKLQGKRIGFDWKTAGTLNPQWDRKMAMSWQWKIYSHKRKLDTFIYRGIQRDGTTRELPLEWPMTGIDGIDVDYQIEMLEAERNALYEAEWPIWPRTMPAACGAYGRDCPRIVDCHMGRMPRTMPPRVAFNYSGMERFMQCNERYRRIILEGGDGESESSPATKLGQAFHAGIAEVYRQIRADQRLGEEGAAEDAA